MNILICLNSGNHISYIDRLLQRLSNKCNIFLVCYKYTDNYYLSECIKKNKIKRLKFIIDTSKSYKFLRKYDEIISLFTFFREDKHYYKIRFSKFGSEIQKQILNNNIFYFSFFLLDKVRVLNFFRKLFLIFLKKNKKIKDQLIQNKINYCLAMPGNHKDSLEIEYINIANKMNIETAAITRSWDVLTTKSLFRFKPNIVYCWNSYHQASLNKLHNIHKVKQTGSMFFDKWYDEYSHPKNEKIDKKLILYIGSSSKIVDDLESDIVIKIYNLLQKYKKESKENFEFIFRPHPANIKPVKKLLDNNIKVEPIDGKNLPESEDDQKKFIKLIKSAFFTIGINTSAMIDSLILGTPTVAIQTKNKKIIQYQSSHFRHIAESDVLYFFDENSTNIEKLFKEIYLNSRNRSRINYIESNIFLDGKSPSKLICDEILKFDNSH